MGISFPVYNNKQRGIGMPEVDIDKQVEKYWEIFTRQLSTEEQQTVEASGKSSRVCFMVTNRSDH